MVETHVIAQAKRMPRSARLVLPGVPMHIVKRGHNRRRIFANDDERQLFVELVATSLQGSHCCLHAYVLMDNHVHLLLTPDDYDAPGLFMKRLGGKFAQYVNWRYRRSGTLWEGRYYSSNIDSERYLFACSRYIENNPVRAALVGRADRFRWSSYACNAIGTHDGLLTHHPSYLTLGATPPKRAEAYRALFGQSIDPAVLAAIRCVPRP